MLCRHDVNVRGIENIAVNYVTLCLSLIVASKRREVISISMAASSCLHNVITLALYMQKVKHLNPKGFFTFNLIPL